MKYLVIVLIAILAAIKQSVLAKPSNLNPSIPLSVTSIANQYHAQDSLGQYSYGYSNIHSSKTESRNINGVTHGGYSYIDAEGKLQQVQYVSDAVNGFRVSGTNIPVGLNLVQTPQVTNTAEVIKDKTDHLQEVEKIKARTQEEELHQEGDEPENDDLFATAGGYIRHGEAIIHEKIPVSVVLNKDYTPAVGGERVIPSHLLPAFAYSYDYQTHLPYVGYYTFVVPNVDGSSMHKVTTSQGSVEGVEKPNNENLAEVDKSNAKIQQFSDGVVCRIR